MRLFTFLVISALTRTLAAAQDLDVLAPAKELFNQGKFQEAAADYRLLLEKGHPSAKAHAGLVRSLLKLDQVQEAERESQQALESFPQSPMAHAARGDVYFRRALMDLAEREYQSARQIDNHCSRAILGLGRVYSAESKRNQARQLFAQAHALDPDDGDALYYWAIGLPYPQNAEALAKHLAEFRDDAEKERREREYLEFIRALAGRRIWIAARDIERSELKLETMLAPVPRGGQMENQPPLSSGLAMVPRGVGLRVKLNDTAASTFLLDTGASGLTIGKKLAEKIGAMRLSGQSLEGLGNAGPASGYNAWVDKINIGDLEFHDCVVHVSVKNDMDGEGEDGLIGTDIFDQYLVTLDFPGRKLLLRPLPTTAETSDDSDRGTGPFSRILSFGHLLLLPTKAGPAASGLFIIDTGAHSDFISTALALQAGKLHDSDAPVQGISGQVKDVRALDNVVLQFSGYNQISERLLTIDMHAQSKALGAEVSGLIGFPTWRKMRVIINYRDGLVDFFYAGQKK